jgi:hypothetical protein
MDYAKIQFSPEELALVNDAGIILTKRHIINKVYELFGSLGRNFYGQVYANRENYPERLTAMPPKIARGEQYRSLPWVMMDFPRLFAPEDTAAIRHFFWWANGLSCTLQVSGIYQQLVIRNLQQREFQFPPATYIGVHDSPWEHHYGSDNYLPVTTWETGQLQRYLTQKKFLKLMVQMPLEEWDKAPEFLSGHFSKWMELLTTSSPGDETGLSPGNPKAGSDL